MKNLKDAGFRPVMTATNGTTSVASGTLASGAVVVVASTTRGEGYTVYTFAHEAREAFELIVNRAGLTRIY
ncbi:hypothetical protein LCGC14_3106700 [marine sediment metagenome]|uniref:Uncharacterized protein n=1 Tax=marine sediment metagenome TaxID=412755 RepID=A0A0F8YDT1_9ZZZZ